MGRRKPERTSGGRFPSWANYETPLVAIKHYRNKGTSLWASTAENTVHKPGVWLTLLSIKDDPEDQPGLGTTDPFHFPYTGEVTQKPPNGDLKTKQPPQKINNTF